MGREQFYNKRSQGQERELAVYQQGALEAKKTNSTLGCIYKSTAESQGNLLGPSIQHLGDHIWRTACRFGVSRARKILTYWSESGRGLEDTACEEGLRELGFFSLKKKSKGRVSWCPQLPNGEVQKRWSQAVQSCTTIDQEARDTSCNKGESD